MNGVIFEMVHGTTTNSQLAPISKHLKGQVDPSVGDVMFFWIKAGQLDPLVT